MEEQALFPLDFWAGVRGLNPGFPGHTGTAAPEEGARSGCPAGRGPRHLDFGGREAAHPGKGTGTCSLTKGDRDLSSTSGRQ